MDIVGHSVIRGDAWAKACGLAKYTDDCLPHGTLYAKLCRSDVAAGRVLSVDTEEARSIPGVVAVFTYADVPDIPFATAGHPYTLDRTARDVEDRRILTGEVRYFGDEIAVVVAQTEAAAEAAAKLIRVEIAAQTPILDGEQAILPKARGNSSGFGKRNQAYPFGSRATWRRRLPARITSLKGSIRRRSFSTAHWRITRRWLISERTGAS